MVPVPKSLAALTPSFMTEALAARFPGAAVAEVELGQVADGTNLRARLRLRYVRGEGPASVFVKLSGRLIHRLALVALGALGTEARLAQAGVTLPLEHPQAFFGSVDALRLAAVVISEDVTERGGTPNDATRPLSIAEVRHGLEGLARLHAAFSQAAARSSLSFLSPWRLERRWAPVSAASLLRGMRRLEASGCEPKGRAIPKVSVLERQFRQSAQLAASGPQTLLHGDPHPGNTYALAGGRTGFYDWQLARVGHFSHDVGYFLISSLEVADRRAHEAELLAAYLDAFGAANATVPSFADAFERYRATPAFGLATWLHTLSFGTLQPKDVCLSTIGRFLAAYDDLDTACSLLADERWSQGR
jgi:hypothetical protein